jgi:hypothetical protein
VTRLTPSSPASASKRKLEDDFGRPQRGEHFTVDFADDGYVDCVVLGTGQDGVRIERAAFESESGDDLRRETVAWELWPERVVARCEWEVETTGGDGESQDDAIIIE